MDNLKELADSLTNAELVDIIRMKIAYYESLLVELTSIDNEPEQSPIEQAKRRPGRPKGSKNKKQTKLGDT